MTNGIYQTIAIQQNSKELTWGVELPQKVIDMLHNEAQNLLVQAYEQIHDAQIVAKCFQVSTSTIA